jgi:hypothetical protein
LNPRRLASQALRSQRRRRLAMMARTRALRPRRAVTSYA